MKTSLLLSVSILFICGNSLHAATPIDLLPLYTKTPAGGTLAIAKGDYKLTDQLLIAKKIHIVAPAGSTITAPAQHACFNVLPGGAGTIVEGLNCDKANEYFVVQAGADNCELRNCTVSNVVNVVFVNPGVKGFKATNVIGQSNSVTYYLNSPASLINCQGRSVGEYAVRWEGGLDGFLIQAGEYTNAGNADGKDTFGARNGSGKTTGTVWCGNIRVGQENQTPVPAAGTFSKLQIDHCTFEDQSPGHTYVEVKQGCEVWEQSNTFATAKEPAFAAVSGGSLLYHNAVRPAATQPASAGSGQAAK